MNWRAVDERLIGRGGLRMSPLVSGFKVIILEVIRLLLPFIRLIPSFMKNIFGPIRHRLVEQKIMLKGTELESAYISAYEARYGTRGCPFHVVITKTVIDNRSFDSLSVKKLFLRLYLQGAPYKTIMWNNVEGYDRNLEFEFYPRATELPSNRESILRVRWFIPPYVNLNDIIWLDMKGYLILNSSFGPFKKNIVASISVDPKQWK